jgi:hypothetical protein
MGATRDGHGMCELAFTRFLSGTKHEQFRKRMRKEATELHSVYSSPCFVRNVKSEELRFRGGGPVGGLEDT